MALEFGTLFGGDTSVGFPDPNQNQTPKHWQFDAGNGGTTVYTVPAGKSVYITLTTITPAVANRDVTFDIDGTDYIFLANTVIDEFVPANFNTPILADAGSVITATSGGSYTVQCTIAGWEQ